MTKNNGFECAPGRAAAIGGRGLVLALALAGAVFQGCTTEDKPSGPAATDIPPAATIAENERGEDLNPDGSLVNPHPSDASNPKSGLAKLAPDCVDVQTKGGWTRSAQAWNHCNSKVRIRFIWAFGGDGSCNQLSVGGSYKESRQWPTYFAEIQGC